MRDILLEGSSRPNLHTYVNYAHGDESIQSMYGFDKWRYQNLLGLKKTYDPHGRFNAYAPIV
jgi:FAD/FMN-containing dehydrogenase